MDDQQWNWYFTPSTTPTNATFSPTAVQTPGTNTHFQDAFSPYLHQQNAPTPSYNALDFAAHSLGQDSTPNAYFGTSQAQQASHSHPELQSFAMSDQENASFEQNPSSMNSFMESLQVQTPPPTRDASTKRRSQRTQSVVFGTPSSMANRRPPPTQQMPPRTSSIQQHPSMVFSQPDMGPRHSTFAPSGHATPSVSLPSNDAYWDPAGSTNHAPQRNHWDSLDDPFSFQPQPAVLTSNGHGLVRSQSLMSTNQVHTLPSNDHTMLHPRGAYGHIVPSQAQRMPNMMSTSSGVNPNLLYSSPNRFMSNNNTRTSDVSLQSSALLDPVLFDSESQGSFLSPDKGPSRPQSRSQQGTGTGNFDASMDMTNRPMLRRSNTTAISRPHSMYGSFDTLSRSNSTANIPRRPSPLKRVARNSLTAIAETAMPRTRTSVVLTVDSKGRARTETRVLDPSPTKSLKTRYPNLFDESDDESDSDASTQVPSQNVSFSSSRTSERQSKMARLDPPLEGLEGLHLPRSNSSASMRATPSKAAYVAAAQLRRQSSAKKPNYQQSHARRNTMASLSNSFTDLHSMTSSMTSDMSHGDAGSALREVMEGRGSQQDLTSLSRQSSRHRAAPSSAQRPSFPPRTSSLRRDTHFAMDSAPMVPQGSPTKSNDLSGALSSITRCVCHMPLTNGQLMIQCNSCQMWLHTACLGIHPQHMPPSYICTFCTSHAPTAGRMSWETAAV